MRSGVIVHPGETNGCIGCHEDRLMVPPVASKMPIALRKKPATLAKPEETELYSYMRDMQPVFDKHCVECHDFGKEAGESLLLAADRNPYFNASYIDLHIKEQIRNVGGGSSEIKEAKSWGSHASNIVKVIEAGHHEVSLSKKEMESLYTWLDLNGIYYPFYESAYPNNPAGRSPLTFEELGELSKLTGVEFKHLAKHQRKLGPQIAFERPELSPCLQKIKNDEASYQKALSIIHKGKERLQELPRADMVGFEPCDEHKVQINKYMKRLQIEKDNNKAISEGQIIYDTSSND